MAERMAERQTWTEPSFWTDLVLMLDEGRTALAALRQRVLENAPEGSDKENALRFLDDLERDFDALKVLTEAEGALHYLQTTVNKCELLDRSWRNFRFE